MGSEEKREEGKRVETRVFDNFQKEAGWWARKCNTEDIMEIWETLSAGALKIKPGKVDRIQDLLKTSCTSVVGKITC